MHFHDFSHLHLIHTVKSFNSIFKLSNEIDQRKYIRLKKNPRNNNKKNIKFARGEEERLWYVLNVCL